MVFPPGSALTGRASGSTSQLLFWKCGRHRVFRLLGENRQGESASQKADGGGYGVDRREMIHVVYTIRGMFLPPFFWRMKNPVGMLNTFSCRYSMVPKHGVDPAGTAIPYFLAEWYCSNGWIALCSGIDKKRGRLTYVHGENPLNYQ